MPQNPATQKAFEDYLRARDAVFCAAFGATVANLSAQSVFSVHPSEMKRTALRIAQHAAALLPAPGEEVPNV